MNIKKIAVIGAGMMGGQIAEIFARIGHCFVTITDVDEKILSNCVRGIEDRIEKFFVAKGKMDAQEKTEVMARISACKKLEEALTDGDFAIEAATENLKIKKDIFRKMENVAPQHTIFSSNTSYQSITEIGLATKRPDKVIGTHFFNPVAMMRLVEIVKGARTSPDTVSVTIELIRKIEQVPLVCSDSSYGFLANRAYTALVMEAVQMLWERVADPKDIDSALKLGYNLPMGPLELLDFTGAWAILEYSEEDAIRETGPVKGHLHPLIRMMRRAGYNRIYDFWRECMRN